MRDTVLMRPPPNKGRRRTNLGTTGSARSLSNIKKQFGTSVKWWRIQLGISQKELALRAGLHRTYVCDIERGERNPTLENIEKVARALEISKSALFFYDTSRNGRQKRLVPIKI